MILNIHCFYNKSSTTKMRSSWKWSWPSFAQLGELCKNQVSIEQAAVATWDSKVLQREQEDCNDVTILLLLLRRISRLQIPSSDALNRTFLKGKHFQNICQRHNGMMIIVANLSTLYLKTLSNQVHIFVTQTRRLSCVCTSMQRGKLLTFTEIIFMQWQLAGQQFFYWIINRKKTSMSVIHFEAKSRKIIS